MTGKTRAKSLRSLHWDEAKHPRDNEGKFSRKAGSNWMAKVVKQVGARFGDIGVAEGGREPQGRLSTGKGGLIDLGAISRGARERAAARTPATGAGGAPLVPAQTLGGAKVEPGSLKVGDVFMRNGARHEVIAAPRAGRQAGSTVHRVQVRRQDGKTGPVTLTGPVEKVEAPPAVSGRAPGGTAPVSATARVDAAEADIRATLKEKAPSGEWLGLADLRDALGGQHRRADVDEALTRLADESSGVRIIPVANRKSLKQRDHDAALPLGGEDMNAIALQAPAATGRTPGGAESSDDFLARMSAKRQAAKAAGGVTTSTSTTEAKPSVHAVMKAAGIERPDDNGAKSAISRANDRLGRGEDPSSVAGYLREQGRALELEREEVSPDDEQRYSELTQSINSLRRAAKALDGGTSVDTSRVTRKTGGVTTPPKAPAETHDEMIARLQREADTKLAAARAENLATREGVPPTDGRPDVSALVKMQGGNRDYDLGSSRGRKAHQSPDIVRAGNGYMDNQPASAEIMNPVDGSGDYRYRIYNDSNGATLEEGTAPDLAGVKAKVDRIWSSQRGGGMARSPGNMVRYEVRAALSEKGDARGIRQKESQIWEVDNRGNERLVKTRAGDRYGEGNNREEVARLNLAEYDRATAAGETPLALPGHLEAGHLERALAGREVTAAQQARIDAYKGMSRAKLLASAKKADVTVARGESEESIAKRLADADRAVSTPLTTGGHANLDPRVVEQMRKDIRTDSFGKSNNTSTHIDEVLAGRRATAEVASGGLPTAAVRAAIQVAPGSIHNGEGLAEVRRLLGLPDVPRDAPATEVAPGDLKPGDMINHKGFGFQVTSVVGTGDTRTVSGFGSFGADSFEVSKPTLARRAGAPAGTPSFKLPGTTRREATAGKVQAAQDALSAATTRAEGDAAVADMTTTELRHLAEKLNVHIGGMSKSDAQQRIVERAVGSRLNSAAIRDRGNFAGTGYLGGPGTPEAGRTLSLNATGSRPGRSANYDIEGPTKTQAVKMAQLRQRHLADAEAARQRGDDDTAFNKDEQAFDLETDLRKFGYNVDTGKPTAAQRTAARVEVAKRRSFADSLRTPEQAQARQEVRVAAAEGRTPEGEVRWVDKMGRPVTNPSQVDIVRGNVVRDTEEARAARVARRAAIPGRTPGGRTAAAPVDHADVAARLKAVATRAEAEAMLAGLKRPDLEKIYQELRRGESEGPFNQRPGIPARTTKEAVEHLVEFAVGRNIDARAIERSGGRAPGGKA